jgi:hypothetical protein
MHSTVMNSHNPNPRNLEVPSGKLTLNEIRNYRALIQQHPNNISSRIIARLLDVVQLYHDDLVAAKLAAADKYGPYDDGTPMPFGKYKGERLADVPDDYLNWWFDKNRDRSAIILEMDYGSWPQRASAAKKLRLHDYLKASYDDQVQDHRQEN